MVVMAIIVKPYTICYHRIIILFQQGKEVIILLREHLEG